MNQLNRAVATALTAIAAAGFAATSFASQAQALERQPFVEAESVSLIRTAQGLGIKVFIDPAECKENISLMGYMTSDGNLVLCAENHGDDLVEFADTIRHELIHAVQFCIGNRAIFPDQIETTRDFAQTDLGWDILGYPAYQWDTEGEARTLAHIWDESDVETALTRACTR